MCLESESSWSNAIYGSELNQRYSSLSDVKQTENVNTVDQLTFEITKHSANKQ